MNARPDPYAIIAALREENEILRWELEDLRATIAPPMTFPIAWRLTQQESAVLAVILGASPAVATFERLAYAIYGEGAPDTARNCIAAFVVRLRRKLAAAGLCPAIQTTAGKGYQISAADRGLLLAEPGADEPLWWATARRMHANGATYPQIAAACRKRPDAVRRFLNPERRSYDIERKRRGRRLASGKAA
jgi:hypothetical protein